MSLTRHHHRWLWLQSIASWSHFRQHQAKTKCGGSQDGETIWPVSGRHGWRSLRCSAWACWAFTPRPSLTSGTLAEIGPGLFPWALAIILGRPQSCADRHHTPRQRSAAWHPTFNLRALGGIIGALLVFALLMRGTALGPLTCQRLASPVPHPLPFSLQALPTSKPAGSNLLSSPSASRPSAPCCSVLRWACRCLWHPG